MGTVYIVGGQRSDGSEVDQILKLTVTDALQTQDHDTQMKVVGTLKNPIKNPLVALAQNEKTLIVMDAGNLQVVQAFDTSTFQRTDLTTKIQCKKDGIVSSQIPTVYSLQSYSRENSGFALTSSKKDLSKDKVQSQIMTFHIEDSSSISEVKMNEKVCFETKSTDFQPYPIILVKNCESIFKIEDEATKIHFCGV